MVLTIKNMVCDRCIMVVRQQLEHLDLTVHKISLGVVEIAPEPDDAQVAEIASSLKILGFELIDTGKDKIIARIKNIVIGLIHHSEAEELNINFSQVLSDQLNRDYTWLSRLFSENQEITLEKFIIQQKIEKVKELLQYGELTLTEIAYRLGYSSTSHLSSQFKAVTGNSVTAYKTSVEKDRKPIDKI
ncbi:helix-turn-helix domain-containing protein [Hufsiella ginkgonis]|uniref:Helix-turn-helix domain-containing protein n=1 Tax=Hufsiella ginkgonis TaxID=2695274 RepID=A0A7K1Y1Z5_9SPHI|nr:AraC family transcriptional regulator [Hufsiella ginkgonis]MXV17251.1 helix-turn-helix domain-containing protein [Hufsiella ginkgonis]